MKIVIAIPQMGNDLFRKYMKSKYTKSLERAGAEVKWIELDNIDSAVSEALSCDGLLLPGGTDISPAMYGQIPIKECGKPNKIRDKAEPEILNAFLKTGKPIFAICRGSQLLNVIKGGTLKQDIKGEQIYEHSDFLSRAGSVHPVEIEKKSMLFDIVKSKNISVNSIHHQVVDRVGEDLMVAAKSADGFVEAIELENYPFCIGVQWHPEHMSKKSELQRKLFDAFVEKARKTKNG
ncbi:MAG: gamma-glutamyl-gamma-aminobutyrate hydrolase family protein [Eubacterium sp.]